MDKNFLSRFIKGVTFTGTGNFFQIVLGFFGLMVAVRFIPADQFGIFVLVQVIALLFAAFSSLALEDVSITKLIASAENSQKIELTNTAICYKFLIAIIMSLVILLSKPLVYYFFKSEQLCQLIIYIPLFFLLSSFNELFLNILQGFHQYKKMAISQVINGSIKFFLILIFLIVLKMGIIGLIYAFLFSFVTSVLFQYLAIPVKKQLSLNSRLFKKIFRFGFPLGLNNILTFIFKKIDRFMIGAMIRPIGVAYYEIAAKIPDSSRRMSESFYSVYFPHMSELLSKKMQADAEKILNNSLRLISFTSMFLALIVALFQKDIIRILFSERYLESAPALSILMMNLNLGLIGSILGRTLVAIGQSDKPVKINTVGTITNVLGNLIMIPLYGFMGAVYATILSSCSTNPFNIWFLKKAGLKVEVSQYLKPILIFGIFWALFLIFSPEAIIIKFFLLSFFLITCIALSIIKKKDFLILFEGIKSSKVSR